MIDQKHIDNNITVVIRSVGERTENLCRELVAAQVAHRNIFMAREKPFARAVQRTFQIGIEEGRPWTLAVDADTLLLPGVMQHVYAHAEKQEASLFKVQGLVIDKFLSSPRAAGHHLYRTAHLPAALHYIPECGEDIRPETFILKKMKERGCSLANADIVVGFHDFEQYYRDIFRKIFLQSKKHDRRVRLIKSQWEQLARSDYDYAVALAGYTAGRGYRGALTVDADSVPMRGFDAVAKALNIQEKSALDDAGYYVMNICRQIGSIMTVKDHETFNVKTSFSYALGRLLTLPMRKIIKPGAEKT